MRLRTLRFAPSLALGPLILLGIVPACRDVCEPGLCGATAAGKADEAVPSPPGDNIVWLICPPVSYVSQVDSTQSRIIVQPKRALRWSFLPGACPPEGLQGAIQFSWPHGWSKSWGPSMPPANASVRMTTFNSVSPVLDKYVFARLFEEGTQLFSEVRQMEWPEPPEVFRKHWLFWLSIGDDCQDTRTKVLIRDAERGSLQFHDGDQCSVRSGRWRCPYTGRIMTNPEKVSIDHVVPLHYALRNGADVWSTYQRARFANDLESAELMAVDPNVNSDKGDKPPHQWQPRYEGTEAEKRNAVCHYAEAWRSVLTRWGPEGLAYDNETLAWLDKTERACGA